jgi:hypothetical protein
MPFQVGTFKRLPPKEVILEAIEREKKHNVDLTSFMWYIMPVAEKCGERVYDVAAESLSKSGHLVTGEQLKALAAELQTPEGQARHAEQRKYHIFNHVTG